MMMAKELRANRQKIESRTEGLPLLKKALEATGLVFPAVGESIQTELIENQ